MNAEGVEWWPTSFRDIWATRHPDSVCEYVGIMDDQVVVASPDVTAVAVKLELLDLAKRGR